MYEAAAQLVERSSEGAESAALLDLLRQEKCTLPKEARGRGAGGGPGKREQVVLHLEGDDSAYLAEKAQQRAEQRQQVVLLSLLLLYWCKKSASTEKAQQRCRGAPAGAPRFTCFTGTKAHILTHRMPCSSRCRWSASSACCGSRWDLNATSALCSSVSIHLAAGAGGTLMPLV
jgi:hypothetical protein